MNVTVSCPNCQKELETNDDVGRLQCPCGTTLEVPRGDVADRGGEESPCPNCNAPVPAGGVICVSCGYNMNTGQVMGTSVADEPDASESGLDQTEDDAYEEDDEIDVISKYKPLIKLGALVVLVLIGVGIYMAANAKHFGIGGDTPLGNVTEMETYLTKIGLVLKDDKQTDEHGNTTFTYWDKQLFVQTKKVSHQWVRVHADSNGKVVAVFGAYDSGDMGPASGRTVGFLRTLWTDIGGDAEAKSIATDKLHAKWTRGVTLLGVNEFYDETIGVTLPESPYVGFVDSHCHHVEQTGEVIMAP